MTKGKAKKKRMRRSKSFFKNLGTTGKTAVISMGGNLLGSSFQGIYDRCYHFACLPMTACCVCI